MTGRAIDSGSRVVQNVTVLTRRTMLAAAPLVATAPALAAPAADTFPSFIASVKREAARAGIRGATLERAFHGVQANQRVIELDRRQPEFTLTWDQYRTRVVTDARIAAGRALYARHRALLGRVAARYGVGPEPIMGIWGLESDYGAQPGNFRVVEALATLAWEGRRAKFFRSELMDALKILDHGDIAPEKMTGSYAGAMGQPQFMPDSYLRFAVDFSGDGRRDIWHDPGDICASVANYLARSGWSGTVPWGAAAQLPAGFDAALAGRDKRRSVAEWRRMGVVPARPLPDATQAAVILPGGAQGEAFLACHPNFLAIRRYNPSDFYCLSVGLIGDRVTA
jgi:membrane-bound lytic murein transglycosylase B